MKTGKHKHACVDDIINVMEALAPPQLAEEWDNCGLQVGHVEWPVRKIWISLDPLLSVIRAAGQNQVDMVITHHPLILKPLSCIDLGTNVGEIISTALDSRTAIYCAHTNLDSAIGGINDVLARKIGLTDLTTLLPAAAQNEARADVAHKNPVGLGRVGKLNPPVTVEQFAQRIKSAFSLDRIKVAGDRKGIVETVAVCSGSGGSLLDIFLNSSADVYVSGDLKYHDARVVENAGRALIDAGHFATEQLIIEPLAERMAAALNQDGWQIDVEACSLEQDPFDLL